MTIPGPPDNPPGDESEGIRYFDFLEPFEASETEPDPFASEDPAQTDASGEAPRPGPAQDQRVGRGRRAEGEPDEASPRDAFEFALEHLSRASSAAGRDDGPPEASFVPLTDHLGRRGRGRAPGQRARFIEAFDAARDRVEQPFAAIALRMQPGDPASAWFPLVEQGIRSAMPSRAVFLVDRERLRLVALLPGSDDVRSTLADLMSYLREHVENAAEVGHRISVFAAPGGRPFGDGAGFLAEVYDKP
jgi:hypothetical protein